MKKPGEIRLSNGLKIPILYEDRAVLAVDKPAGWMLAPQTWTRTKRNLQLELTASLASGAPWAVSRRLDYIRFVHRLDADTSGLLLLAKHQGALKALSELFREREVEKAYVAVVEGAASRDEWTCTDKIATIPGHRGKMMLDRKRGKAAKTHFRVLARNRQRSVISAVPVTGRTHQIRIHLLAAGLPVVGDPIYGIPGTDGEKPSRNIRKGRTVQEKSRPVLALRAVRLAYRDPFSGNPVVIVAPWDGWAKAFGFRESLTSD